MLLTGTAYLLLCIPGILLSERGRIPVPESFFHLTQFAVTFPTLAAALIYAIWARRSPGTKESASAGATLEPAWIRSFAVVVIVGILAWWAFWIRLFLVWDSTVFD